MEQQQQPPGGLSNDFEVGYARELGRIISRIYVLENEILDLKRLLEEGLESYLKGEVEMEVMSPQDEHAIREITHNIQVKTDKQALLRKKLERLDLKRFKRQELKRRDLGVLCNVVDDHHQQQQQLTDDDDDPLFVELKMVDTGKRFIRKTVTRLYEFFKTGLHLLKLSWRRLRKHGKDEAVNYAAILLAMGVSKAVLTGKQREDLVELFNMMMCAVEKVDNWPGGVKGDNCAELDRQRIRRS